MTEDIYKANLHPTYSRLSTRPQTELWSACKARVTELQYCGDLGILTFHGAVLDSFSQET